MARILLVDDSADLRLILTDLLEVDGHNVITAGDGEAALRLFDPTAFDLVLTDMQMPRLSGYDLIKAIHQRHPDFPIVGMTAGLSPQLIEFERQHLKIPAFFSKPMDVHDLRRTIRTLTPQRSSPIDTAA